MKEYKNSNELLDYIISKGVSVNNKEDALYKIKTYSYYSIINTYKDVFKNTNNECKKNVSFDEIYALLESVLFGTHQEKSRTKIKKVYWLLNHDVM